MLLVFNLKLFVLVYKLTSSNVLLGYYAHVRQFVRVKCSWYVLVIMVGVQQLYEK